LVWLCNTPASFKRYVIEPKGFIGYLERGNAYALNIPMHDQYPSDSLNRNNLAHVGRAMHYPPSLKKYVMEPNVFLR
jgi:hypothetical protein